MVRFLVNLFTINGYRCAFGQFSQRTETEKYFLFTKRLRDRVLGKVIVFPGAISEPSSGLPVSVT